MIETLTDEKIRYYRVDFGHCFTGNTWNENIQNSMSNMQLVNIFQSFIII